MSIPKNDKWRAPIKGVIHVTGMPDSGKTTFCLGVPGVLPEDIAFFDFDGKSEDTASSLDADGHPFFYYENTLRSQARKKPLDVYESVTATFEALKKKKPNIKVCIFDNWSPTMEEALREKGMAILSEISNISPGQAKAISQITWPATKRFYAQWLQEIANWADMVFVITHTKPFQIGQTKVPGVFEARGQDVLTQLPVFRIWTLSNTENGGAPNGLVMKRIKKTIVTTAGMQAVNILPSKLVPCTWKVIYDYMESPVGLRPLLPHEVPSPWEATLVGGEYLPDQKVAIAAAMEIARHETPEDVANAAYDDLDLTTFVKDQAAKGLSAPQIFTAAKEANYSVTSVVDIVRLLQ